MKMKINERICPAGSNYVDFGCFSIYQGNLFRVLQTALDNVTFNIGLRKRNKCVSKYIEKGHTSKQVYILFNFLFSWIPCDIGTQPQQHRFGRRASYIK